MSIWARTARYRGGGPLASITATPIVASDVAYVDAYNFKALPRGRAGIDDVLILPSAPGELDSKPQPATDHWRDPIFERS
jgi:hypothetical protein